MSSSPGALLRKELESPDILVLPGVFNPLVARMVERKGFRGCYLGGGANVTANFAVPDIGLVTATEMAALARTVCDAIDIPVLADADTGFGSPDNAARTVRSYEGAGLAGLHIEDQVFPKKCGHLPGKEVIGVTEMADKIAAAAEARRSKDFVVVGRVDAVAVEGVEAGIARAKEYVAAGADAIFPEALTTEEELRAFSDAGLGVPLVGNLAEFGTTPLIGAEAMQELGYGAVLFPVSTLRVALRAVENLLDEIKRSGTQVDLIESMYGRDELYALVDYEP